MKVILAGMNVDAERLNAYKEGARAIKTLLESPGPSTTGDAIRFLDDFQRSEDLTPETVSAGYARISRDGRPVDEIRREAAREVVKARRSNEAIIFGMGHSSVAEHAVFNLDIMGISRLAVEELQHTRLASYTEKSQRYITLTDDYCIPEEIGKMGLVREFSETIALMNEAYHELNEKLLPYMERKYPELAADKKGKAVVEGLAKEDARYAVPLATLSQMGMTANSRVLEMTVRRLSASPLSEVRELSRLIYGAVSPVAPSVIKYTDPTPYDLETPAAIKEAIPLRLLTRDAVPTSRLTLIDYTKDGDERLVAALLFSHTGRDFELCQSAARKMTEEEKERLIGTTFARMQSYDRALREFELISLTFEVVVSASNFAQLKRHRIASIISQDYDPSLGIEVPPSISDAGATDILMGAVKKAEALYGVIGKENPVTAPYILTNAHKRRVLISLNLRELYHVARLRMDASAQWDIRDLAARMSRKAAEVFPYAGRLLCGKDAFGGIVESSTTKRKP
jgi:flavin-dependent thymidylate synthase